jgi:hypothetical protein
MPRKRKSPAGFSPFGRASRAGKQSGPDYRQQEGKQIESSGSKQDVVSAVQGRMESIVDQLGLADARFAQAIASCMGDAGGAAVLLCSSWWPTSQLQVKGRRKQRREQLSWRGRSKNSNFRVHNTFAGSYLLPSSCSLVPI